MSGIRSYLIRKDVLDLTKSGLSKKYRLVFVVTELMSLRLKTMPKYLKQMQK